jgi:AbrB family looped-hinge helix DNA binding protein
MGKVTSKYQVSIPKALADRLELKPGDEIDWTLAGTELRVRPSRQSQVLSVERRLALFDEATRRQASRNRGRRSEASDARGWKREDLYNRGRTR